jgi:phosphoribosylformylglycinamidine synthase
MAWAAIDEAIRNAVAVGADPDHLSILDNFCWGNPNLPDRLGALVRCSQGCYDAAVAYGTPFISGKDSLNNEYTGADGEKHAIPGTLLVSALGIVPDVARTATMPFKKAWEQIFVVGVTRPELAGSHYAELSQTAASELPKPAENPLVLFRAIHQAIAQGLVTAVHDCAEGGLAVALAEMALAGSLGAKVNLAHVPAAGGVTDIDLLFAESLSRFVVTVTSDNQPHFEALLKQHGVAFGHVGFTAPADFRVRGRDGQTLINLTYSELDQAFRTGLVSTQPTPFTVPTVTHTPYSALSNVAYATASPQHSAPKKVLILHANGSNRDRDAALACQLAGGEPEIVHINQLTKGERNLLDYHMLLIPGGFSYGDDLGAGVLWAADLRHLLGESLQTFVASGRPVLGICNGFQVLMKSGLFEGLESHGRQKTLTYNASARFECRWVYLEPNPNSPSLFTKGLTEPIYCPVAHGEGRLATLDEATTQKLVEQNLVTLTYMGGSYPLNPNGSVVHAAGVCNALGNVMGLMPHPEDHVWPWQHPRYHAGERGHLGLTLFVNGLKNA